MLNNVPIILEGYGAAKFLAEMEFTDKRIDVDYVPIYMKTVYVRNSNGSVSFETNPNYPYKTIEEEREARYKYEQKKREFVLNYLKEHYSSTDYAERYGRGNKWDNPLRYHTEDTKNCVYLEEDGRHCIKRREYTSCYTCCFNCTFAEGVCEKGECVFIKG